MPISAIKKDNLDLVLQMIPGFLPESPPLFPEDMKTNRNDEFHISEIIREKLTLMLHQEVPYGLTVQIEQLIQEDSGLAINAIVWVECDSQKGIAIGKDGGLLKKVGRAARLEISKQFSQPVHLELWVKVKSNWADNEQDLMSLGYEAP